MPKIIYYAVRVGRETGVFTDWDVAAPLVVGHSGAVHKKFSSRLEAERFVNGKSTEPPSSATNEKPKQALGKRKSISPPASNPPAKPQPQPKKKRAIAPPPSKKRRNSTAPSYSDATSVAASSTQATRKINVYCDGSAVGNGKKGARAGYGVWFEDQALHHLNEARRLPGKIQTNNRAELLAIVRAIQLCPNDGRQLLIFTDSQYSMDAVTKWIDGWKENGWFTATGKEVLNKDLIVQLDHELNSRFPKPAMTYVKGHSGIEGNEIADRMAKLGATLPECD
ncbi:related to Ribonuclease H [Moesziomyces antarcticus]|nr:related to Ribonuclease H [Moesziomyces antarcticus]